MVDSEESWKLAVNDSWGTETANDGNSASATANETQVSVSARESLNAPTVHVEPEGVIDTRYLCGRGKSVGEHHIQSIRIRIARYFHQIAFTRGVEVLEKDGYISDAKDWKKYNDERDFSTAKILSQARVVFVTTSSAAGTFLKYLSPLLNILIIDECGCAKPQDIAIPMMALGSSFRSSSLRQHKISKTLFVEWIKRGYKTTRLNTEYRSHLMLYETTCQLFYQGTVHSYYDTVTSPPPMLVTLAANPTGDI